ncbi:MAG: MBL fold metallo-hydrolase [Deltaproteobacteria bacterium]|nr:MBL fold metallo-hydrolase [Deltaproteobacteria bacterium]
MLHPLLIGIGVLMVTHSIVSHTGAESLKEELHRCGLTVVFDNVPQRADLETGWGYACLVEGFDRLLLFDTGSDGEVLLRNMKRLGHEPERIDTVFLSHSHGDHTGGLDAILRANNKITVFYPASFPPDFQRFLEVRGASGRRVRGPERLFERVHSTGEMGTAVVEQGLVLETPLGLVLLTGCAHPGIAEMAERTQEVFRQPIRCIVGGFHLQGAGRGRMESVAKKLMRLGVRGVAPSHCTGESARGLFRELWGNEFIESGLGASIRFP